MSSKQPPQQQKKPVLPSFFKSAEQQQQQQQQQDKKQETQKQQQPQRTQANPLYTRKPSTPPASHAPPNPLDPGPLTEKALGLFRTPQSAHAATAAATAALSRTAPPALLRRSAAAGHASVPSSATVGPARGQLSMTQPVPSTSSGSAFPTSSRAAVSSDGTGSTQSARQRSDAALAWELHRQEQAEAAVAAAALASHVGGAPLGSNVRSADSLMALQLQQEEDAAGAAAAARFAGSAFGEPPGTSCHGFGNSLMFPAVMVESSYRDELVCQRLGRTPSYSIQPRVNSNPSFTHNAKYPPIQPSASPTSEPVTEDVVSPDRDRLLLRLDQYDLTEKIVVGDGACQFRSLSDQLYGSPDHHDCVRQTVVQQLQQHPERYSMYVPSEYAAYCADMAKPGTWGDHVTLQAAADAYGLRIMVLTSFKQESIIKIDPAKKQSERVLWLSFWAEVHYNSIYPRGLS